MPPITVNETLLSLVNWLMPPTCVVCAGNAKHRDLCHECALILPWNLSCCARCALPLALSTHCCANCVLKEPPWAAAISPFVYDYPIDSLLRQLKFSRRLPHGYVLGHLLAEWIASLDRTLPDLLLPVPLHWGRELRRQFNQAAEISRPLSQRLGVPIAAHICRRRYRTPQQSGLSALQRRRNLRNAFVVDGEIDGASVAIVDDVMTTGSTLSELSRVLIAAGAARVDVWTVARVPRPGSAPFIRP